MAKKTTTSKKTSKKVTSKKVTKKKVSKKKVSKKAAAKAPPADAPIREERPAPADATAETDDEDAASPKTAHQDLLHERGTPSGTPRGRESTKARPIGRFKKRKR